MAEVDVGEERLMLPSSAEVDEARKHPGGWVYRIAGHFRPDEDVPPEAIVGAWQVDATGVIVGAFHSNAKYDSVRYPAVFQQK